MRTTMMFLVFLICGVVNAQAPVGLEVLGVRAPSASTNRVTVQRVAQLRALTRSEVMVIETYLANMAKRDPKMTDQNRRALDAALRYLVAIDHSHIVNGCLTRTPNDYLSDYQTQTQLLNRVDWYVNIPTPREPRELPPFETAGPAPKVELFKLETVMVPCTNMLKPFEPAKGVSVKVAKAEPLILELVTVPCANLLKPFEPAKAVGIKVAKAEPLALCGMKDFTTGFSRPRPYWPEPVRDFPLQPSVARKIEAGAIRFDRPGYRSMDTIGGAWVSRARSSVSRRVPSEDCGPGQPGPEPPPNGGSEHGDPSGLIPCPPATDPFRPTGQSTHGTNGQPWDPGPDHYRVADPVVPGR